MKSTRSFHPKVFFFFLVVKFSIDLTRHVFEMFLRELGTLGTPPVREDPVSERVAVQKSKQEVTKLFPFNKWQKMYQVYPVAFSVLTSNSVFR